ncbi:MAG: HAD superfamily hydrolase (TIGR01509 family) [Salibacteraceae bacterium]
MTHNSINTVIFDLGGVLLNLDYTLTIQAFENLGLPNAKNLFSQKAQNHIFDNFETGKIASTEFRKEIKSLINGPVSDQQIDAAWNTMLLDFPTDRFEFLQQVSQTHRIFLLSNTNAIHMAWFKNYIDKRFGENIFFDLFEVAYLSNEMGMRKPHQEIFDFVVNENNLDTKSTLFIDDSAQHLIGATAAGLQTVWLEPGMETIGVLKTLIYANKPK